MKYLLHSLLLASIFTHASGQQIEKVWFDKNDPVYGYYVVIKPASGRVQGAVVLFDGFNGNADGFLTETKIHNVAYANDLLTVCVPTGQRLYADTSIIHLVNTILTGIVKEYGLKKDKFAIGGMSSGGTIAIRYAELCRENPSEFPINPQAVFDVDSPVDLAGLYDSSKKDLQSNSGGWWLGEDQMIIDKLNKELGDKTIDMGSYNKVSPFYAEAKEPGNEKFLKDVAFRTYHDVDVNWHIQNRRHSIFNTNMLLASELVNRLALMGNGQAEFVSSKIEGRRSNGVRHPHSWNIVDEIDLVQWIKDKLHFYPDHIEKPYVYNAPANWATEVIMFPMDFAPAITYRGFEELRFAPGWDDPASYQKWAYTIVWWMDDAYTFSEKTLQQDLESYFTGLTHQRAVAEHQDLSAWFPAKVKVQKIKALSGDRETYTASADIFDAQVTKKPGTLYYKIHIKDCPDKTKTIALLEVAENPFTEKAWQELDKVNEDFKCGK